MKTIIKSFLLALLAVLALCAVASASASASEFVVEGTGVSEATKFEGASGVSLLAATIAGVKFEVECTQDTSTGALEAGGDGSATLLLKTCKESKPVNCSVPETIEGKLKDKLIGGETPEEEFEAASGETIFEIKLTGSECAIKGTYTTTGTQKCELPKASEELVEHEVVCKKSGSSLKISGNAATFSSTEKAKLTTGKKWGVLAVPAPRPETVDFRGNQSLLVDHLKNTERGSSEAAVAINEYGALNEVEWESTKPGTINKIWPLVYVLGEKVKLEAHFAVTEVTRTFLEKDVEGEPEFTGETAVAGGSLSFKKKLTIEQIKKQFTEHAGYLTTEVIESSAALVSKVAKSMATITWKWTLKEKGRENPIRQELGKTTNTFYLLYKTPIAGTKIFLTLLDLATQEIGKEGEPLNEEKVTSGIWAGFTKNTKEAGCLTLECPTTRIRTYNPINGEITRSGNVLWYYEQIPTGLTLTKYIKMNLPACRGRSTTYQLLATLSGECGAWARAFKNSLATEGIASTQLRIFVKYPVNKEELCEVAEACAFLVKQWEFIGKGSSGEAGFPYTESEMEDQNGTAGQGVENPRSAFRNHQIIEVGNKLYDPSYGTEPVGTGAAERTKNLEKYQEKSISAFCRRNALLKWNCSTVEAGKLKMEAVVNNIGETTEEEEKEEV
jgi:hypothetical protein